MPASTPIARCKTAALCRVLDAVPRGYTHYTRGVIKPEKAAALANKFHQLYGIGCTPGQRIGWKRRGEANALLVLYWPENCVLVEWLLLVTPGSGPVHEREELRNVTCKPRLQWLGYELARYGARGVTRWTWRRPQEAMADWYAVLTDQVHRRQLAGVGETLAAIARQPGFHGVREQSWALCQYALKHGYQGELPFLFYVHKVSHGEQLLLTPVTTPGASR
jgi:hypothetical protein